jgi:hypothetical protein
MMRKAPCAPSPSYRRVVSAYAVISLGAAVTGLAASLVDAPGITSATGIFLVVAGITSFVSAVGIALDICRFRSYWDLFSGKPRDVGRPGTGSASGLLDGAGWRVMCLTAKLMPPAAGRRWLVEAESFLAEAPPALRRGAIGNYLTHTPQLIAVTWVGKLARAVRDQAAR